MTVLLATDGSTGMASKMPDLSLISRPSPNHDSRNGQAVDMLVMHYTDMLVAEDSVALLCAPESKVSAHYVVAEDGRVFQLVEESERAWHAGESHWRGFNNINARSIGIEICNPGHGHGYADFPMVQMEAVAALSQAILTRHTIPARNVQGHSDIAFLRKKDPGEKFNWRWLAARGIGIFPDAPTKLTASPLQRGDKGEIVMRLQQRLSSWGYGLKTDGDYGEKTEQCVIAFQRHYRPESLDGVWDEECAGLLAALHGLV